MRFEIIALLSWLVREGYISSKFGSEYPVFQFERVGREIPNSAQISFCIFPLSANSSLNRDRNKLIFATSKK